MKMEVGKTYRIKKDFSRFRTGDLWTLTDKGFQAYFGEYNFIFVNTEKCSQCLVLRDASDEDMEMYRCMQDYFEEFIPN